jgi:predicted GIY-YIG superfamily endonuclease
VPAVYILHCADGSLYIGETADLSLRLAKHQDGSACAFTARRRPVTLVYSENYATRAEARERERQLKALDASERGFDRWRSAFAETSLTAPRHLATSQPRLATEQNDQERQRFGPSDLHEPFELVEVVEAGFVLRRLQQLDRAGHARGRPTPLPFSAPPSAKLIGDWLEKFPRLLVVAQDQAFVEVATDCWVRVG